jgi:hypothetical protein
MKITVVNATAATEALALHGFGAEELAKYGEVQTAEFFLPKDMPHFCNGCFSV